MRIIQALIVAIFFLGAPAAAEADSSQLSSRIGQRLVRMDGYGSFDWIDFSLRDGRVTLSGYVCRAELKKNATRVVRALPGVSSVDNRIQVLPDSSRDDRLRVRAYMAVYTHPVLRIHAAHPAPREAVAGLLDSYHRLGLSSLYLTHGAHGIHIIVGGGRVVLLGRVTSESERDLAQRQVHRLAGVTDIENRLQVDHFAAIRNSY